MWGERGGAAGAPIFEVLTTRNISLYLAVSYYISLYLTVSLISHHIRDGFCEQSRPGEGYVLTWILKPYHSSR